MRRPDDDQTRDWSIARRVTMWVTCCVTGALIFEAALASWLVSKSLERELDALIVEEAAELRVALLENRTSAESLDGLTTRLDREHPEVRISLRAWLDPEEEAWVEVGAPPRIPWDSIPTDTGGGSGSVGKVFRWHKATFPVSLVGSDGVESEQVLHTVLLLDGLAREAALTKASAILLLVSLGMGLFVLLAGLVFSRRLASMLESVAESASLAHGSEQEELVAPDQAPLEIRRVVDAFRRSLEELRAGHSRNVLLTAGLAHELRSPLQNLLSEAEVGLLSERDGPEYRRLLASQLEELRKLALVTDNLITLTALRDRQNLPRGEEFDFATEARMRLGHEEEEASRRNVTIEVHEHGNCEYYGDREALVLMLRNLVGNAVRWTAVDTTIDVTLDGSGETLRVTVDDQGPGVPEEEAETIFGAFYQGAAPRGSRRGYGLGLALARTAARAEGGDIVVRRTEAGGARFVVDLPRPERSEGRTARENDPSVAAEPGVGPP